MVEAEWKMKTYGKEHLKIFTFSSCLLPSFRLLVLLHSKITTCAGGLGAGRLHVDVVETNALTNSQPLPFPLTSSHDLFIENYKFESVS